MLVFFSYFKEDPLVKLYFSLFGKNTSLVISWITVILEIILPILLWFKRTRIIAFILLSLFLIQNAYLLQIGIFPYLSILCIILFFFLPLNDFSFWINTRSLTKLLISIYITIQILLPMRVFLYKDYIWQGSQSSFFAWNMFLAMPEGHISYLHLYK
jgi:vitamin K-dependent gamma-carboxylase